MDSDGDSFVVNSWFCNIMLISLVISQLFALCRCVLTDMYALCHQQGFCCRANASSLKIEPSRDHIRSISHVNYLVSIQLK